MPSVPAGVLSLLFALETDLAIGGQDEIERYKDILSAEPPRIAGICVAGRGFYYPTERVIYDKPTGTFFKEDHSPILGSWSTVHTNDEHAEVMAFLATVVQLTQQIGPSRGQPPLDAYFNETEESQRKKVRLTSGPHAGSFVGLSARYDQAQLQLNNVGYSFCGPEQGFAFPKHRADEIRAHLNSMGIEAELTNVAENQAQA